MQVSSFRSMLAFQKGVKLIWSCIAIKILLKFHGNLFTTCNLTANNLIYNLEAVATHLKIFMGLALVHFQKYWLLSKQISVKFQENFNCDTTSNKFWLLFEMQAWIWRKMPASLMCYSESSLQYKFEWELLFLCSRFEISKLNKSVAKKCGGIEIRMQLEK